MSIVKHIDGIAEIFGGSAREAIELLGGLSRLTFAALFKGWRYGSIIEQMYILGIRSIGLVLFLSSFTGFISVLSMWSLTKGIARGYIGTGVFRVVVSELGPTFVGLVLAARLGATVAAEIASMKITEQLDALVCLGLNPLKYVINPRVVACTIMGPVLYIFSCTVAIFAAQLLATAVIGVAPYTFYNGMKLLFSINLVGFGVLKSLVFSFIIGMSSTYCGYSVKPTRGAIGVGESIRAAVVSSSLLILLANAFISGLLI